MKQTPGIRSRTGQGVEEGKDEVIGYGWAGDLMERLFNERKVLIVIVFSDETILDARM